MEMSSVAVLCAPQTSNNTNPDPTTLLSTQPVSPKNNPITVPRGQCDTYHTENGVNVLLSQGTNMAPLQPISFMLQEPCTDFLTPFAYKQNSYNDLLLDLLNSVPDKRDLMFENPIQLSEPAELDEYEFGNVLEPWQVHATYCGKTAKKRRLPEGLPVKKAVPTWYL